MSDRFQQLTVTLDGDYSAELAKEIVAAIKMVRGVQDVHLGKPADTQAYGARQFLRTTCLGSLSLVLSAAMHDTKKWERIEKIAREQERKS